MFSLKGRALDAFSRRHPILLLVNIRKVNQGVTYGHSNRSYKMVTNAYFILTSLLFRNRFRHHSNFQCSNLTRKNWSVLAFLRKSGKHTSVQRAICKYFLEIDISGGHYLKNLPLLLIFSWCVIYHILYIILRFAYFLRRLRLHLHLHLEENKRRDDTVSVTYNFRKTSGNAAIIMSKHQ